LIQNYINNFFFVNIPNILSISRIPVVFVIVWLMDCGSVNTAQWAFGLYVVSALTDWLDGYLARKWQQITDFGKFIDALADKVLTSGLFVGLLSLGRLPEWGLYMVLLILTREFMVTGLRLVAAGKGHIMPAEKLGKWKTALQMITIGLYLCRDAKLAEIPQVILNNVGDVAFGAAGVLTVVSGVSYFWKNRSLFA
jgi:CDP-diacylglycerol--glycerol-3-phosphate 3-phosphatidyltransferase